MCSSDLYTLKDLKFSGASGNYVMSEVTGLIGYIGGLGEAQSLTYDIYIQFLQDYLHYIERQLNILQEEYV